ncbi:MAG: hypothetical protein K0S23_1289 [Fluviicola sp.]|jgi:hypothetical protein|nr:hypothetical protein [Fluviicola sp.]
MKKQGNLTVSNNPLFLLLPKPKLLPIFASAIASISQGGAEPTQKNDLFLFSYQQEATIRKPHK